MTHVCEQNVAGIILWNIHRHENVRGGIRIKCRHKSYLICLLNCISIRNEHSKNVVCPDY